MVLTAAASLREFWPLSWVLPFQGSGTCLAFVPQFEAPSELLTHSIPRSFLVEPLSASAVGLTDALLLCPERAIRLFFASVSLSIPLALSPLSLRVFTDGIRPLQAVALAGGVSPCVGFCRNPWGSWWLHLYRLTPVLVSLRDLAVRHLGLRSVFHTFPARRTACIPGDNIISLPDLYVYQHQQSRWVMLFGHLPCRVTGLT